MRLVTRAQWGALSRTLPTNITPQHGGVTFHYVGASQINDSHSNCAGRVRGIQNHHINGNGWSDIAYSLLVCQHGYVFVGRGVHRRTAANGTNSGNQNWYAICYLIGGSQEPTDVAVQAGRDAVAYLRAQGNAGRGINGHRDHLSTSCPGAPVYALVRAGELEPGSSGNSASWEETLIGLNQGDQGEGVKAVQRLIVQAGHGDELAPYGVDGDWGPATSAGLLACRKGVGSGVSKATSMTGEAFAQLIVAMSRHQARKYGGGSSDGGSLPTTVRVSGELELER